MSATPDTHTRTRSFARVLGPYLVIVTATVLVRASDMQRLLSEFGANSVWPWVSGAFVLLSGLVVITLHPYWRGAPATVVSIVGWLTTLKGFMLLAFPTAYVSAGDSLVATAGWWQLIMVLAGLAGLYLCYVGWAQSGLRRLAHTGTTSTNLPHAA